MIDCGDTIDVKNKNGLFVNESECTMPCPGDPTFLCGAGNRLNTYFWDGPDGTANTWHTPNNKGRYEVCSRTICFIASSLLICPPIVLW